MNSYQLITETIQSKQPFIIHEHQPRSGSKHYDLRFLDSKDPKLLHSFAAPIDFLKTIDKKTILVKTKDHDPRWLELKSYRLKTIDTGHVEFKISTKKYYELIFDGKVINGTFKLFKIKSRRDDNWILIPSRK